MAVAALLTGARGGAPEARVVVLFVVFAITATVWVRGQYADSLESRVWLLSKEWVAGFCIIGIFAVEIFFYISPIEWLGLAGMILIYFGVGSSVMGWRQIPADKAWGRVRKAWGTGLLISGLVAGGAGFAGLGRLSGSLHLLPAGMVVLALLVLLPLAVALLSEEAILWLAKSKRSAGSRRTGGMVGGALVFLSAAGIAVGLAGSTWILIGFVTLGLLIWALASTTQADIVGVVAVLALMGVTPLQATLPQGLTPGGGSNVLVALGDSYMSGEGASIYYTGTDDAGHNTCRRSPTSWAAQAGQQRPFDKLAFLACSGARTSNVRADKYSKPTPRAQTGEPGTQLEQYETLQAEDAFTPGLVVLSIGGNDAGFSTIGLMCLAPGNCSTKSNLWFEGLDQVEALLRGTFAEVRDKFRTTPVVVTAYPDPIYETAEKCGQVALSTGERKFLTGFLHGLNERVQEVAAVNKFYYLGSMESALAASHLQLCDPLNDGRPGLNFIGLRSVNGIAEQRFSPTNWSHSSLHPNERGHAAMLRVFQNWLGGRTLSDIAAESSAALSDTRNTGATDDTQEPCDLFDISPSGCRPQGQAWVEQQVGALVLTKGLLGLLAALGAWAAGVAFYGWRRSRPRE